MSAERIYCPRNPPKYRWNEDSHIVRRTQKNRVGRSLEWAEGAFTGEETASGNFAPAARRRGGQACARGTRRPWAPPAAGGVRRGRSPEPPRPKGLCGPGAARRADARDPAGPGPGHGLTPAPPRSPSAPSSATPPTAPGEHAGSLSTPLGRESPPRPTKVRSCFRGRFGEEHSSLPLPVRCARLLPLLVGLAGVAS